MTNLKEQSPLAVCLWCGMECKEAPTDRGWHHAAEFGQGLHFDCILHLIPPTIRTMQRDGFLTEEESEPFIETARKFEEVIMEKIRNSHIEGEPNATNV